MVPARCRRGSAAFLVPSAYAASRVARAVCVRSIRSTRIPWCPTPPRETRTADDNFAAADATLRDDIAKLCPARVPHRAEDAVDAELGMPGAGVGAVHLTFGPRGSTVSALNRHSHEGRTRGRK
jgi:hypothetical protein